MGSWRVTDPAAGTKLLEIANESWNAVFSSSRVKEAGSPAEVLQVMVVSPPEVGVVFGTLRERAEMRGTTKVRTAIVESISEDFGGGRRRKRVDYNGRPRGKQRARLLLFLYLVEFPRIMPSYGIYKFL